MWPLECGLKGRAETIVYPQETAESLKTGRVLVWGTPAMVRLMEEASVAAVEEALPPGSLSVGASLTVRHLAPTPLGAKVHAEAELVQVEGRRLTFLVRAYDEVELVGEGTHTRVIVDGERFRASYQRKAPS